MGRNREQFMEDHLHIGEPSYYAYVHIGCRHDDCFAAMQEYRQRLQDRRTAPPLVQLPSTFVEEVETAEVVLRDEVEPVVAEPFCARGIPALPTTGDTVQDAPSAAPGAAEGHSSEDDQQAVMKYLKSWVRPGTGQVLAQMDNLELMAGVIRISADRAGAAAAELVKAGRLRSTRDGLFVVGA